MKSGSKSEQDLRRSSGRRSLRLCATLITPLFALISKNVSGFLFESHMSPRSLDSEPKDTNHRHEALSEDSDLTLDCSPSNACMLLELYHSHLHDQRRQRVLQFRPGPLSAFPV